MSAVANSVSKEWTSVALGDLCKMYQPGTITKSQMKDDGAFPVFGANGVMGRYDFYNHEKPQLVVGCRGACGTVHITDPKSWITGNSMVIQPDLKRVDLRYLRYFFEGPADLASVTTGAAQPQITQTSLRPVHVPLPLLEEQKRIVAVLDKAFAALDRARTHAEANLVDAEGLLENSLDEVFRDLASTNDVVRLEEAVHPECKLSYGIVQPGDLVEGGLPIVRPVDLKQRVITLVGLKSIAPKLADGYARTKLVGGELLLCVRGSTGEISIAAPELAGGNVTRGIVPIRFEKGKVLPEFAYFQFLSRYARDQIASKTYGAALMQINIKDLRQLNFVLPHLSQQHEIVVRAEGLYEHTRKLKAAYAQKLTDLANLRQSLLQKAFAGELT